MSRLDENRNLGQPINGDQIVEVIGAQEQLINQLRGQIENLQAQQTQIQQAQNQIFTPKDILQQLRQLRCLDENHNVMPFIKSVEAVMLLCPRDNIQLMNLATTIVANEKIVGEAGRYIQELGDNITWTQIKAKLMEHYKPRTTYGDVFNKCRNIKVCNLRELFNYFEKCKHELNEIYLFDIDKPLVYKPDRVDKDLVNILIEKIDIPLRSHLDQASSLNDIITKYSQIKALDDPRVIHIKYRKNVNRYNKPQYNYNNANTNTPTISNTQRHNYSDHYTKQHQNTNRYQNQQNRQNYEFTQNSNRGFNNNHYRRENNTYQTRNTNRSAEPHNSGQAPEPMEIGTLLDEQLIGNNEINFTVSPQNQHYP